MSKTAGGVAMTKGALGMTCTCNDLPTIAYKGPRVNSAHEAMRRSHRQQTPKAAGITPPMTGAALDGYGFVRPDRPATRQWQLMTGASIGIASKLLLRDDDLNRCRWEEGSCEVFETHIRYNLDGRNK